MAKSEGSSSIPKPRCSLGTMDEVRLIFNKYDVNGDGKISYDELRQVLSALGQTAATPKEARCMLSEIDRDGDGFIDPDEFAEFFARGPSAGSEDEQREIKEVFDIYDLDKNGRISAKELHTVMAKLGEKCSLSDCRRMVGSVDRDGDGEVDFEEFKAMMTRSSPSDSNK
ncbi:probable calcium-binding protein CML23 [Rhodamnia argentea]|uniref:Probable calcium-binding protein CML23 n=1 Tax=Rhodamnia argentea TaxID=178133 RepID=A0A8B8PPP9_9MYRT|nr:probable calcium-binding protein CML23 [Rhodamnia argentea]